MMDKPRSLGRDARGCRQTTLTELLHDFGVAPTPELVQVEARETRDFWRRRQCADRVQSAEFVRKVGVA